MSAYTEKIVSDMTNRFIESLEKGDIPWHKPWNGVSVIPHNFTTGKAYRGVFNPIILWMTEEARGFNDCRWAGKGQILKAGGRILRDEFKRHTEILAPILKPTGELDKKGKPVLRCLGFRAIRVYNAAQCEGLAPVEKPEAIDPSVGYERAAALIANSGSNLSHSGNRAFYRPATDSITMPEAGYFDTLAHYWATNLHEHAHWTGHATRLDRKGVSGGMCERSVYAFEELVAEMSAAFLCQVLGIDSPKLMENHEAYLNSWVRVLKSDPKALVNASRDAQKAMDFLLKFDKGA